MKKLHSDGYRDQFDQVFKEWLDEDIIEEVPDSKRGILFTPPSGGEGR